MYTYIVSSPTQSLDEMMVYFETCLVEPGANASFITKVFSDIAQGKQLIDTYDDNDHAAALREIERLWGAKAGTPKADLLELLGTLVDAYEAKHHAIEPPDPIEAIKFRMEQQGLGKNGE